MRRQGFSVKALNSYIQSFPKAELHLHLEGSVGPSLFNELACRYETEYASLSLEELISKVFHYKNFNDFLNTFKIVCQHLRRPEDYEFVLKHLATDLLNQGVFYAEITYAPSIPWQLGFDGEATLQCLLKSSRAFEKNGLVIRWILDCVRQFGVEAAWETARLASKYRDEGVVALGLGGDEMSLPMSEFRDVFLWAKAHELYIHVHAGEIGEPDQVWSALRELGANRIGHGVQAARDPRLIEYLREHSVGLDVCLTSNIRTHTWTPLTEHPFRLLYQRGVPVTLNTDDPGLFQTSLTEEYMKASRAFSLTTEDIHRIVMQAVRCSFLPHSKKMLHMQKLQNRLSD